ncbi:MAG: hypothetical protein JSR61_09245 [Proteobacteria bacterium]|nr:hypothetical protein [Pseudomonadota bacterium]
MFIVLLKFSANKTNATQFMEGHKAWLKRGFDDGIFLLAGSLKPALGGGVMAHRVSRDDLTARIKDDPFVVHDVVTPEIIEFEPSQQRPEFQGLFG